MSAARLALAFALAVVVGAAVASSVFPPPPRERTAPLIPRARDELHRRIRTALPEPHAGLVVSLTLGVPLRFSEIRDSFIATGTVHVMALSGWNVTVIAFALERVLRFARIRRGPRLVVTAAGIVAFVGMVGASPSLVRATFMGLAALIGHATGRPNAAARALLFSAAIMLALDPWIIRDDIGFLLSFAATAGILYLTPLLMPLFRPLPEAFALRENAANTTAASLATLPIVLAVFGTASVVALPANLTLLPFIPLTIGAGVAAALGAELPVLGAALGAVAHSLAAYDLSAVRLFARLPGAGISGFTLSAPLAFLMGAGIVATVIMHRRRAARIHELDPS